MTVKKRIPFSKQREICRENGMAYYEKVTLTPGTYVNSTTTFRLLMCKKEGMGGQCMPVKCKDMRVIDNGEAAAKKEEGL